jgi:hypothetical protein
VGWWSPCEGIGVHDSLRQTVLPAVREAVERLVTLNQERAAGQKHDRRILSERSRICESPRLDGLDWWARAARKNKG